MKVDPISLLLNASIRNVSFHYSWATRYNMSQYKFALRRMLGGVVPQPVMLTGVRKCGSDSNKNAKGVLSTFLPSVSLFCPTVNFIK